MMYLEGRAPSRPSLESATTERGPPELALCSLPLFHHSIIPLKLLWPILADQLRGDPCFVGAEAVC
jgi:hypothetical protein